MKNISDRQLHGALHRWSWRALAAGRAQAAIDVAEASMSARPSIEAMITVAQLRATAGFPADALATLRKAERRYPEHATLVQHHRGMIYAGIGEYEQSVAALQSVAADWPTDRSHLYHLASVLAHCRRFDEANAIFARRISVKCGDLSRTTTAVIRFPSREEETGRAIPFERTAGPLQRMAPAVTGRDIETVYFVACDMRYLRLFAEPLATSLALNGRLKGILHIHVVNPEPSIEATVASLTHHSHLTVRCSTEQVKLEHLNERQRHTYYTCARYFVLPELIRHYALPVIVADIDQFVTGSLDQLVGDMKGRDVGLLRFPNQAFEILGLISASVLLLSYTPGAMRFADLIRNILAERMTKPEAIDWHLDQAALAAAHLVLDDLNYLLLRPTIMDSTVEAGEFHPPCRDALFWSVTFSDRANIAKLRSPWFRQFLREIGSSETTDLQENNRRDAEMAGGGLASPPTTLHSPAAGFKLEEEGNNHV